MKRIPQLEELPYDELCTIGASYVDSFRIRFIIGALKAGLFDFLNSEISMEELAEKSGFDRNATGAVLNVLAAAGLIRKRGDRFINSEVARTYFVSESPTFFGETLVLMDSMYDPVYGNIDKILREGFPRGMRSMASGSEYIWALQARKISRMHCSGPVQQMTGMVKKLPEWSSFRKMLDVGGSSGLYTIGFVQAHPSMRGVVFDRSEVVRVAEETIKEYRMEDRISVLPGSYMDGPLGSGYDFIWASDSLNFAFSQLNRPISLIYEALKPGGVFVSNHFHIRDERSTPLNAVLFSAWHWMAGEEMYFYEDQVSREMLNAGFRQVQSIPFCSVLGFGQMDIARK